MAHLFDFSGNYPEISKTRRKKLGIYLIKTPYYGHIQHEKKLPDGSFFSYWTLLSIYGSVIFAYEWPQKKRIHGWNYPSCIILKCLRCIFINKIPKIQWNITIRWRDDTRCHRHTTIKKMIENAVSTGGMRTRSIHRTSCINLWNEMIKDILWFCLFYASANQC